MAERARRWATAEAASPLSRTSLQAMVDHVAERIAAEGHDGSSGYTLEWLHAQGVDPEPVLTFLAAHRVGDDFSLLMNGDPYTLFGPTAERLAWMPISPESLEELKTFVDAQVQLAGCEHSTRWTRLWLQDRRLPVGATEMALLAQGGGCDCEVVMNVRPEAIFPKGTP